MFDIQNIFYIDSFVFGWFQHFIMVKYIHREFNVKWPEMLINVQLWQIHVLYIVPPKWTEL